MKAKSLLALLAVAAMLCTTALPAYAEDTLPDAPAVVEEQAEEAPADDTQPETDASEQQEVTTLETPENEDKAGEPVVQSSQWVNIGGTYYEVPEGQERYYTTQNGALQPSDASNWNVYAVGENDGVHVTLNNAELPDTNQRGYAIVSSDENLHVTLLGSNKGEGTVFSRKNLTIDGDGSLETVMKRDTGWHTAFGGEVSVTIGGSVTLNFNNAYEEAAASGIYSTHIAQINDNVNISLTGNLEAGIYVPGDTVQISGGTVRIYGVRSLLSADGSRIRQRDGVVANFLGLNGGSLILDDILGNGVNVTNLNVHDGLLQITNVKRFTPEGWDDGYGGKAVTTAENITITGGKVVCDANEVNDLFANQDVNIGGGTVKLTNGGTALTAIRIVYMSGGDVTIENTKYGAVFVLNTGIQILGGKLTINHSGSDAMNCVYGGVSITGYTGTPEIYITDCQGNGISLYQGSEDTHNRDIVILNAKVEVASQYNAFNAFWGGVIIDQNAVIKASSTDSNTIGCPNVKVTDNTCDVTLTSPVRVVGNAIRFDTDGLTKLGGVDAGSAHLVDPEEMPDCQYLHIFKGQDLPREEGAVIDTKNWTEGDSAKVPTITDKDGNALKAKVYYKVKGADDSTYTETVPTAAGEYEVALVVPADGTYAETVYYGAFTIVAKSTQPSTPSNGGNSGNTGSSTTTTTTTTVTATAPTPTPAPRAEAKAQSAPAAVTATIPQTSDTFPYAGLAALMGAVALGMAGITVLRKKRQ